MIGVEARRVALVVRGVMAITQAITNLQGGLGLVRDLASLARVGLWGFRGKDGSILFNIQTKGKYSEVSTD